MSGGAGVLRTESERHPQPGGEVGPRVPHFEGLLSPSVTFISFSHGSEHLKTLLVVGADGVSVLRPYQHPADGSLRCRWPGLKHRWLGPTLQFLIQPVWGRGLGIFFSDKFLGDATAGTGLGSPP